MMKVRFSRFVLEHHVRARCQIDTQGFQLKSCFQILTCHEILGGISQNVVRRTRPVRITRDELNRTIHQHIVLNVRRGAVPHTEGGVLLITTAYDDIVVYMQESDVFGRNTRNFVRTHVFVLYEIERTVSIQRVVSHNSSVFSKCGA